MKLFVVFVLIVLVLLVLVGLKVRAKTRGAWPYRARKVLTEPEQVLFWRLQEASPGLMVLAQVGLSRVLVVAKGTDQRNAWFRKISQKSLDFVVCRKDSSVVAAIELDDRSHESRNRQKGDADKAKALDDAGVPLLRWNVKALPSVEEIKRELAMLLVEQNRQGQKTPQQNMKKRDHVEPFLSE